MAQDIPGRCQGQMQALPGAARHAAQNLQVSPLAELQICKQYALENLAWPKEPVPGSQSNTAILEDYLCWAVKPQALGNM